MADPLVLLEQIKKALTFSRSAIKSGEPFTDQADAVTSDALAACSELREALTGSVTLTREQALLTAKALNMVGPNGTREGLRAFEEISALLRVASEPEYVGREFDVEKAVRAALAACAGLRGETAMSGLSRLRQLAEDAGEFWGDEAPTPATVLALIAVAEAADELLSRYEFPGYPSEVFAAIREALSGLAAEIEKEER